MTKLTKKEIRRHFNIFWDGDRIKWSGISKQIIDTFIEKDIIEWNKGVNIGWMTKTERGKMLIDYTYEKLNK